MDEEQGKPEPKLHAPIIIFGLVTFFICDVLSLIPFVANVLDAGFVVVVVVLALSGVGGTLVLAVNFLAVIVKQFPILQALPFFTFAWVFAVLADRNQKVKAVMETSVAAAGASKKLSGAGGGAMGGTTGGAAGAPDKLGGAGGAGKGEGSAGETGAAAQRTPSRDGRPSEISTERKQGATRPSAAPKEAGAPEGSVTQKPDISKEALGEQPTPFEEMEKTFKEAPAETKMPAATPEEGSGPQSRIGKANEDIREKLDRYGIQDKSPDSGEAPEEEDENKDLPKAA